MHLLEQIDHLVAHRQIDVIFFDIGQVLILLDLEGQKQHMIDYLQTNEETYQLFFEAALRPSFVGKIDTMQFDKIAKNMFDINVSLSDVWSQETRKQWHPNIDVIDILPILSSLYKLSIISNILPAAHQLFVDSTIAHYFQYPIFSNIVGLRKPNLEIYKLALQLNNVDPEQIIFIDDKQKNIEAAQQLGMHGILYTPPPCIR